MSEKKIKVYLQYPWKFLDSAYYKYLIENRPNNIEYLNIPKDKEVISNAKKFKTQTKLKINIRRFTNFLKLPIPNAHLTRSKKKYDLIHCAHCLSLNKKPWIADVESVWSMWVGGRNTLMGKKVIKKIINSKNCKKIMPWSEYTKKEIFKIFPEKEIRNKIEVVYPAVPWQKVRNKKNKRIIILYIARSFWIKGGIIALEALRKIRSRNNVKIICISDIPRELKNRYPEILFLDLMPQKKVFEYYKKADIFFYPSFVDTFGFALLEAMSFGLPIITINTKNTKTRPEIIKNNHHGLIFNVSEEVDRKKIGKKEEKIISKLVKNTEKLIKDNALRKKMSKYCIETIKKGKRFSLKERNKKLRKIYEEAIK